MVYQLFNAKPSPEAMLTYCKLGHLKQTSMKLESKYDIYQENAVANVAFKVVAMFI